MPHRAQRMRSEFFAHSMSERHPRMLCRPCSAPPRFPDGVELAFTAMGGAYSRVREDATAFAHRHERFLLQHIAAADDPWLDDSWVTAHADGSGRVYPNFPDLALEDWAAAYHADNYLRLSAMKRVYDPHRLLDFPQAI